MFDASYMPRPLGLKGSAVPGTDIVSITDRAQTRNDFYGGQIGLTGCWKVARWKIEFLADVGLGDTRQWESVTGITQWTNSAGTFASVPAGLFAVGDNRGEFSRDRLSFMTEEDVRIGYQITHRLLVNIGYSFLYWSSVVRAGNQFSEAIDPHTVPSNIAYNPAVQGIAPPVRLVGSDYWATGLNFGLEFRY
jgi:hypothetical protein